MLSRFFRVALLGALALPFSSCQEDVLTGRETPGKAGIHNGHEGHDRNTLAVALATVPANFIDAQYVAGLNTPVAMEFAPDGRLFICEKGGALRVVKNGALNATPFLTVPVDGSGERGLLGVAIDPNFPAEPFVYVYYTVGGATPHNRISRFQASSANPDVSTGVETILFELSNLGSAVIHNGGAIHFGTDGKLYAATGENSVTSNAQSMNNQLGKILRINKDGTIPSDNPFFTTATGNNRAIWALGFRNPYTFAVQPGTGRIFVNDVGQDGYEEVNDLIKGSNYGWPVNEGPTSTPGYRGPVHGYVNQNSGGVDHCSIIGAAFYNPVTFNFPRSTFEGDFFYGDWCGGYIKHWDPASNAVNTLATGIGTGVLVDIKVARDGVLYYLQIQGQVRRITYAGPQAPAITTHPASRSVGVGQAATFSVAATGSAPLAYQWQRNGVNIAGATSDTYTLANPQSGDNNAQFRAVVSNSAGSATSNAAVLTINSNRAPVPVITNPAAGATYTGGTAFNFTGTASDPDQGNLPASAFTWRVDFHHDTHSHPVVAPTTGSMSGNFTAATSGEISSNVWYRITLSVTDAQGWTVTVIRDIQPVKAVITLATNPPGLQLTLDGTTVTTPHTFTGVAGIERPIGAISPQTMGGQNYAFASWSDGGAQTRTISTPNSNTTFTAAFTASAWATKDIGSVGAAGSHSISGGTHTLRGSGADIWGNADGFRFAWQSFAGDGQITARVASVPNSDAWAKAGVMIRESDAAGSRHALMAQTFGNGAAFQRREATGGASLHTGAAASAPLWVRLTRAGNSLKGFRSTDGNTWTQTGESVQSLPATLLFGLAVTSHNNGVLGTATFDNVTIVPTQPQPPTWTAQDIGSVGLAGSTSGTGTLTVKGAGADIYNAADGFHFYHRSLNADGEIRARIVSITNTHQWAKAGVMIRENTAVGSRHVYMGTSPASGLEFVRREATNGATTPVGMAGGAPRWVRVTRVGNVLTAYHSADGAAWTQAGAVTLALAADVRVGLAVCSHNTAALNTAVFDNVSVTD